MYLQLAIPLLFSVLIPVPPPLIGPAEVQESYKISHEQHIGVACNCVEYARTFRPDIPLKNADTFAPTSDQPFPNAVAVMRYPSGVSHIAIVKRVVDENTIELLHANVVPCTITSEFMSTDNVRILGYR